MFQYPSRLQFLLAIAFCTAFSMPARAQISGTNQWTWMGGSSTVSAVLGLRPGIYGIKGVPAPTNIPPTRVYEVTWTGSDGRFWFFGGSNFTTGLENYFDDLWVFDPSTSEWTWIAGNSNVASNCPVISTVTYCGQPGVYGALGIPALGNSPGARQDAQSWTDASGHLWLYGGEGFDAAGNFVELDDLWEFDTSTSEWTWMGGDTTVPLNTACSSCLSGIPAVPGTQGTASVLNTPGSLWMGTTWTDHKGNFWLFSGWGVAPAGFASLANELWEFSLPADEWTWVGGDPSFGINGGVAGTYGTLGTPAPGNFPGTRWQDAAWVDTSGNLWLFGGQGFDSTGANEGILNDLWKYDPSISQWAWMGGSSAFSCAAAIPTNCREPGVYGTMGQPSAGNIPGSRYQATSWTDNSGNLWLFGGDGFDSSSGPIPLNDLWEFSPATNEWIWMSGSSNRSVDPFKGVYGIMGVPSPANVPGARNLAVSWTDKNGNLWLWGGIGVDSAGVIGYGNDLWRYQPVSAATFSLSGTAVTVTPGATTGNTSTITITSSNGFTGSVALSATVTSSPAGAVYPPVLSFATTNTVNLTSGSAGTATLAISTTPSTSALLYPNRPVTRWPSESGAVLACLVIFASSPKRRKSPTPVGILALLVVFATGLVACGGGGGGSGADRQSNLGTTLGTYTITVKGVSGSLTQTTTISLTVQ